MVLVSCGDMPWLHSHAFEQIPFLAVPHLVAFDCFVYLFRCWEYCGISIATVVRMSLHHGLSCM
jgi:hypothetical protein